MEKGDAVNFLEFVVKSIVDHPDDVKISKTVDEMGVLLSLNVNAADMGQIVGKQGTTAKALRTLLRIVGIKASSRISLKIEEPGEGLNNEGLRKKIGEF